jgi:signal transduction histidine kinase
MAISGVIFTMVEHRRHVDEVGWPWLTIIGIAILGIISPTIAWTFLHWSIGVVENYLSSRLRLMESHVRLETLNALALASSRSLDLEQTISTILEKTMDAVGAAAGMVFLQKHKEAGLRLEAHRGISSSMARQEAHLQAGHCLCGRAIEARHALFADDVGDDPRCISDLCICEGFRSVACAPLEVKGELVGLLQLASPQVAHFTQDMMDFISTVAGQVSVSIENARLYDAVRAFNVELEQKVNLRTRELESARWALAEKARQLQRLLKESYRIQESTQARIAQDMHDGVTQMVIGALYELQAARQIYPSDSGTANQKMQRSLALLEEVEGEIRRVIYDLHPPVLDMMGIVVAVERYVEGFSETFQLPCSVAVVGDPKRLPRDTEIAIYRIIQSALNNVASHAQANKCIVGFNFDAEMLTVKIEDDGVGFDHRKVMNSPGDHLGLIGMKERAEGLGAQLEVIGSSEGGTVVSVRLPSPDYLAEVPAETTLTSANQAG